MARQSDRVETTKEERDHICRLAVTAFEFGFDDHRIFGGDSTTPKCLSEPECADFNCDWSTGRNLQADDLKITQVWSKQSMKAAHLGQPTDRSHYRLGIRFKTWRRKTPTHRLALIIHELGHLVNERPPHRTAFWHRIADATARICDRQDAVEDRLDIEFNPHVLKNDVLSSIKYADGLDDDRDTIEFSTAKRLDYPPQAIGNMTQVGVGATDYAKEKADEIVPVDEIVLDGDYDDNTDAFVWGQMLEMAPAGFRPSEHINFTSALPVTETDDGTYETCGYSTDWQLVAVKRLYAHDKHLRGDRAALPEAPVEIRDPDE